MPDKHAAQKHIAHFRFYEELNDFLPRDQRKRRIAYEFIGKPTVKNLIESIGVPQAEIDLILVNGESVDFDHHMYGGEQVSVYPTFETLDISPIVRLRPKPLRNPSFVVDVNLGKLAHKLRLLGFDALFKNDFEDSEIVDLAVTEKRIILTRDVGILMHTAVTHGYWVRNDDPVKQLEEVVRRFQLEHSFSPLTRCSTCNGRLFPAEKADIKGRIADDTFAFYDEFWECRDCGQIYWKGSHFDSIDRLVRQLRSKREIQ